MIITPSSATELECRTLLCGECFAFAEQAQAKFDLPLVLFGSLFQYEESFSEEGDWSYPYDFEACHVALKVSDNVFLDARGLFSLDDADLDDWLFSTPSTKETLIVLNIGTDIEFARSLMGGIEETHDEIKAVIHPILDRMDISVPKSVVIRPLPVREIDLANPNLSNLSSGDNDLLAQDYSNNSQLTHTGRLS